MDQRVPVRGFAMALPGDEPPEQDAASGQDEQGEREAEDGDRGVLRRDPPPGTRLENSVDEDPQAGGRQHRANDVELRSGIRARGVGHLPHHDQDKRGNDDLADEHDPPRQDGRGPAAHDGADRDPRASDPADDRVSGLAPGPREVAGNQRRERRKDQRRADALEHRPPEGKHRYRLGQRGQRRAAGVDDQSDDERPAAADHVADLGPGEDEHGHDQAVQGDDRLDRGDRGVEVVDQRADRDVHHGLVQHHEELRRGQGDQCQPALIRRGAVHVPPLGCALLPGKGRLRRPRWSCLFGISSTASRRPGRIPCWNVSKYCTWETAFRGEALPPCQSWW